MFIFSTPVGEKLQAVLQTPYGRTHGMLRPRNIPLIYLMEYVWITMLAPMNGMATFPMV